MPRADLIPTLLACACALAWVGEDIFYDPQVVSVVAMGFCFPGLDAKGGDLPPRRECAELWRKPMFARMPNLELILLVGRYDQKWHLARKCRPEFERNGRSVARYLSITGHPRLMPMPHPSWRNNAWLKRNPWFETELLPVLRADIARIAAPAAMTCP